MNNRSVDAFMLFKICYFPAPFKLFLFHVLINKKSKLFCLRNKKMCGHIEINLDLSNPNPINGKIHSNINRENAIHFHSVFNRPHKQTEQKWDNTSFFVLSYFFHFPLPPLTTPSLKWTRSLLSRIGGTEFCCGLSKKLRMKMKNHCLSVHSHYILPSKTSTCKIY